MSEWFKALRGDPAARQLIAFDIEGRGGPGGFVCGSIQGESVSSFYTDRAAMFEDLLHYGYDGYWIFSHNLQYDLPILEGPEFPRGEMLFTKYGILSASYKRKRATARFYDSMNLFPRHSVARIGRMVNYPKDDLPADLLSKLSKGRAWSEFSPIDQEKIRHYCMRDAEIVLWGLVYLQELVLSLGGQLRPTISGTAMDLYRRKYHAYPWPVLSEDTNAFARPAFYGGRVENFAVGHVEGVNMYDVTSLYPSVQAVVKYPHPAHLRLDDNPSLTGEWWKGEGVVDCEVEIRDQFMPPLPHRFQSRLFFPTGHIRGRWTVLELRRALEYGATLVKVNWVMWSPVVFQPFERFVQDLFSMRLHFLRKGSTEADLVKLLLNSLYGRWGLNPEGGLYRLVDLDTDGALDKFAGYQSYEMGGRLVGFGRIPANHYPDYVNVFLSAQISSAARIVLYDELVTQGENAIYCDTDSIITRGEIATGEGLGQWRAQMTNGSADLIGPKEYTLHNAMTGPRYVAKGVPEEVAQAYLETGAARFFHAVGIREALRDKSHPSSWIETFKTHQEAFPKRYPIPPWRVGADGILRTRPYQAQELGLVTAGCYLPPDLEPDYRGLVRQAEAPPEQERLI